MVCELPFKFKEDIKMHMEFCEEVGEGASILKRSGDVRLL